MTTDVVKQIRKATRRKWVGMKEVWIIEFLTPLARAYPEARFIVIMRDPRAVIASMQALARSDPSQLAHTIARPTGAEALELLEQDDFHLLLLDIQMPEVDGIETLRRGKKQHPNTQFIIMTAHGSLETAMEAIDQGAFNYITKPFDDVDFVLSRIQAALERVAIIHYNINMINRLQLVVGKLKRTQKEKDAHKRLGQTEEVVGRLSEIINELQEFRKKTKGV